MISKEDLIPRRKADMISFFHPIICFVIKRCKSIFIINKETKKTYKSSYHIR